MTSRWQLLMSTIFYVDNVLAEAATPQDLLKLQQQLRDLLLKRGFDLRKWRSNSSAVMEENPQELYDPSHVKSLTVGTSTQLQKNLGVYWDMHIRLCWKTYQSLYHQMLHRVRYSQNILCSWLVHPVDHTYEDSVPIAVGTETSLGLKEFQDKRQLWREHLPLLQDCPVRCVYHNLDEPILCKKLHRFSDASESTYAAVVSLRTGPPSISLVAAKTNVSQLKRQTIPQQEICGANLLAKLMNQVQHTLHIDLDHVVAWSDFQHLGPSVSKSMEACSTTMNPANCASRGLLPQDLMQHSL